MDYNGHCMCAGGRYCNGRNALPRTIVIAGICRACRGRCRTITTYTDTMIDRTGCINCADYNVRRRCVGLNWRYGGRGYSDCPGCAGSACIAPNCRGSGCTDFEN